jgi:hypothetical protein
MKPQIECQKRLSRYRLTRKVCARFIRFEYLHVERLNQKTGADSRLRPRAHLRRGQQAKQPGKPFHSISKSAHFLLIAQPG